MMYTVLERTPFPGNLEAMPLWELQRAEFDLQFNQSHYYERARRMGDLLLYSFEDATRIVGYWQALRPWAEFRLFGNRSV